MNTKKTKSIAIVTGASSGLGRQYTYLLDKDKDYDFDELWLIARREQRLAALASELKTPAKIIPLDLAKDESISAFAEILKEENPDVRFIINAAGYGKIGPAESMGIPESTGMVDLNCKAAVAMTQVTLPYMHENASIVEICSTAGFQPFQYLATYAASKAFLYRYSRALRVELSNRKISVTAVCPYWVKDTEFIRVAEPEKKKSTENIETKPKRYINHYPFASKEKSVAKHSYRAAKWGWAVSTPSIVSTIHFIVAKIIPSDIMMALWALLRRI